MDAGEDEVSAISVVDGFREELVADSRKEVIVDVTTRTVSSLEITYKEPSTHYLCLLRWFSGAARRLETYTLPPHTHPCSLELRIPRDPADSKSSRCCRTNPILRSRTVGLGEAFAYNLPRSGNNQCCMSGYMRSPTGNMHDTGQPSDRILSPWRGRSRFGEEQSQMPSRDNNLQRRKIGRRRERRNAIWHRKKTMRRAHSAKTSTEKGFCPLNYTERHFSCKKFH